MQGCEGARARGPTDVAGRRRRVIELFAAVARSRFWHDGRSMPAGECLFLEEKRTQRSGHARLSGHATCRIKPHQGVAARELCCILLPTEVRH